MSEDDATQESGAHHIDSVDEKWSHNEMGVLVERVTRHGIEEDQKLLKVFRPRKVKHGRLDGQGTQEVERMEKIAEFTPQAATEVLFGLAEAHGYDLEGK